MLPFQISAPRWGGVSHGRLYEKPDKKAISKGSVPADSSEKTQNGTGTRSNEWHKTDTGSSTPVPLTSRQSFGKVVAPAHKLMSRMLGYCLTLDTAEAWSGFRIIAAARLSETERAALAFSALNSLDPDHAEMTAVASFGSAGMPPPPFLGGMDEARFWSSYASRSELKAYALAAYEAMSPADQMAFRRHISEVEIAA